MKNYPLLLLLLFALAPFPAHSQADSKKNIISSENTKYIYCELIDQSSYWSGGTSEAPTSGSRTSTFLVFGSKSNYQNQAEERQYVSSLKNGMDALDYMSQNGWELVFRNIRGTGSATIETNYLFRKKKP
jgi:hypothetical protein